jgi:hypothetical protein
MCSRTAETVCVNPCASSALRYSPIVFGGILQTFAMSKGSPPNRGGEDVPIIGIGKLQSLCQILVAGNQRVYRVEIHRHSGSLQFLAG